MTNANAKVETSDETSSKTSSVASADISVASIGSDSVSGTGSAFDPAKESSRSEPLNNTVSKLASQPSKPKVKGDSVNGKQPTNSALTDKSRQPHYTSQPSVKSKSSKSKKSTSKKTSNGNVTQGTDPIFGNSHGTGGQMTTVGNPGDHLTGNKVGTMN